MFNSSGEKIKMWNSFRKYEEEGTQHFVHILNDETVDQSAMYQSDYALSGSCMLFRMSFDICWLEFESWTNELV